MSRRRYGEGVLLALRVEREDGHFRWHSESYGKNARAKPRTHEHVALIFDDMTEGEALAVWLERERPEAKSHGDDKHRRGDEPRQKGDPLLTHERFFHAARPA